MAASNPEQVKGALLPCESWTIQWTHWFHVNALTYCTLWIFFEKIRCEFNRLTAAV